MSIRFSKQFLEIQPYDETSDKLQCLVCGNWYKGIVNLHTKPKHGITVSEYKEMFGINRWQSLSCLSTKNVHSETGNNIGINNLRPANEVGGGMLGKSNKKRMQTINKLEAECHWNKAAEKNKKKWERGDLDHLREVRSKLAKNQWKMRSEEEKAEILKNLKQYKEN